MNAIDTTLIAFAPSPPLRRFVSHYWLGRNNADPAYSALPDGAIDVVVEVAPAGARQWVYGTTTTRTNIALMSGAHYVGIRFFPGQARHFVDAPARELTDRREAASGLLRFSLDDLPQTLADEAIVPYLDAILQRRLLDAAPTENVVDQAVALIQSARGGVRIEDVAARLGKSQRQIERAFSQHVGISAKLFASIARFRRALALLRRGAAPALVAAELGYVDQSHMNRAFKNLAGESPARFVRGDVGFVQDAPSAIFDDRHSLFLS